MIVYIFMCICMHRRVYMFYLVKVGRIGIQYHRIDIYYINIMLMVVYISIILYVYILCVQ